MCEAILMAELKKIPLDLIDDHPNNPRLVWRQDVIDAIAASLGEEYPQHHAIHVRPIGERYQILSGHQRVRAARKAGLTTIWAWVDTLDDEAALMELVTSNNQGELSPLEIGIHCLQAVPLAKGGRGQGGGLAEYARKIGKTQGYLVQLRNAAEVLMSGEKPISQLIGFLDKAQHLAAIHDLPKECWGPCVAWLAEHDESKEKIEERVKKTKKFLENPGISERWRKKYLPIIDCAMAVFAGEAPSHFATLSRLADEVFESLKDHEDLAKAWVSWLEERQGSWDIRKVQEKRNELDEIRIKRANVTATVRVYKMDALEFLKQLPNQSADLLLTDPPYMTDVKNIMEFAQTWVPLALTKIKPSGRAYIFTGAYPEEIYAYLDVLLKHKGEFTLDNILVWTYRNTMGPSPKMGYKLNWQACFYLYGPEAPPLQCHVLLEQFTVHDVAAPGSSKEPRLHAWQKPDELAERFIRHSTKEKDLIIDPFAGTGTFLAAAQKLGRHALGAEIDQKMIELCQAREIYVDDSPIVSV
jgi:ParB/RepB/Spo0J family partition protein